MCALVDVYYSHCLEMEGIKKNIANWLWNSNPSPDIVSPQICMESFPYLTKPCLHSILTKLIGVAIIVGACLNKAPVLFNVAQTKSTTGLAVGSVYGEVIMYSNGAYYGILRGIPFTAWGENGIMTFQSLCIALLLWKYKDDPPFTAKQKLKSFFAYLFYLFVVFRVLKSDQYYLLHMANWPVLLYARGAQIACTYQLKHTGSQSIITTIMNCLGCLIRVFTTYAEVGLDIPMLSGLIISIFLNLALLSQFYLYRENTKAFLMSKKIN